MVPSEPPLPLHGERVKHLLEGVHQSRSDPARIYISRVMLYANFLCPCNASVMRDTICHHLQDTVNRLSKEELVAWIFDSQAIPAPIVPEET